MKTGGASELSAERKEAAGRWASKNPDKAKNAMDTKAKNVKRREITKAFTDDAAKQKKKADIKIRKKHAAGEREAGIGVKTSVADTVKKTGSNLMKKLKTAHGTKKGKAAIYGTAALAATVTAWYLYRKLRKSGAEKAEAAKAAAEVAEKKAKETGSPADAKKAAKWRARAQRYATQG